MPYLREELGLNYTQGSLHFSAWSFGVILAGSFGHLIIRKLGVSRSIWIAGSGLLLAIGALLLAKVIAVTIFSVFIGGACGSTMGQGITTIMSERFKEERRIALTEANIGGSLFAMVSPLVVGQFVRMGLGWRIAMILPLVYFVGLLVSSRKVFSAYSSITRTHLPGPLPLRYWFFWIVIWLSVACEWSIIFWAPDFLQKGKGLLKEDAVQSVSIFLVSMLISRILGVRLSRRFLPAPLLAVSSVVALIGFLIYWLGKSQMIALVGLGIAGLGNANIYPLSFSLAIASSGARTTLAAARMSISTGSAVLIAPLVVAAIGDRVGIHNAHGFLAVLLALVTTMLVIASFQAAKQYLTDAQGKSASD